MGKNFLDPQTTNNNEPYGPWKYKQTIKELYIISKNTNTSYTDLLGITPTEKNELLTLIIEDNEKSEEALQKLKAQTKNRRKSR